MVPAYYSHLTAKQILQKYVLVNSIYLFLVDSYLHGSFDFDIKIDRIKPNQFIARSHWNYPLAVCNATTIIPPLLSDTNTKIFTRTKANKNHKK